MRKRSGNRFRKRAASAINDHSPQSTVLRTVRDLVQRGSYAAALTQINHLVDSYTGEPKLQLMLFAADSLFKQGKFSDAATTYATLYEQAVSESLDWLRPGFGQVRSLLKAGEVTQGVTQAGVLVAQAATAQQQYQQQLAQAQQTVAAGGQAMMPVVPPGVDVVASRLGRLFLQEGESGPARDLFQAALQVNAGHGRAQCGLAEIALRESRPAEAEKLLRGAINLNQNNAATIAAWPLLVAACQQTGTDPLSSVKGLAQAKPSVRARTTLVLARALRAHNDVRWQNVSADWLRDFNGVHPIITVELNKLTVAANKRGHLPAGQRLQGAKTLLSASELGPQEWLSGAKELVRARLANNTDPQLEALISRLPARVPAGFTAAVVHGLARVCQQAGQLDLALSLYQRNAAASGVTAAWWGRAIWAMSKIKQAQGDSAGAASLLWQFYQQTGEPARLRYYALMEWTRLLTVSGQAGGTATASAQIIAALPALTDFELVLDLARQVKNSALGADLAGTIFQKGWQLGTAAFTAAGHPSPAATILFKVCRRANDFAHYDLIIGTWTGLSAAQKEWLWSTKGDYWSYLELVFRAYRDSGQPAGAEQFINGFLNDAGTPPEGYAILAVSYAALKRQANDLTGMFAVYQKLIAKAPAYAWTSEAYYWLGLRAWQQGEAATAAGYGDSMLMALGKDWGMKWKRDLGTAAWCLKTGLDGSQIPGDTGLGATQVQLQLAVMEKDLAKL